MPKRKQSSPVKLGEENKETIRRIAEAVKAPQINVLGWAVEALGQYFDHHQGRLLLPLNFSETFRVYIMGQGNHTILEEPPRRIKKLAGSA